MHTLELITPTIATSEPVALEAGIELFIAYAEINGLKCDSEKQIREWITRDGIYSVSNETTSITLKS